MASTRALTALVTGCGIGGDTLGLRAGGWRVVGGIDRDPRAVAVYRAGAGDAWCGDVAAAHVRPGHATLVWGDLPRQEREFPPGSFAWETLRLGVEAGASAVVLACYPAPPTLDKLGDLLMGAGYWPTGGILQAADFGVPQFRRAGFVVGFRKRRPWRDFRWPHTTHTRADLAHDVKKLPWVTVREAVGIPYDEPSPCLTTTEHNCVWRGYKGGRSPASKSWRAGERIAHVVGRGAWGARRPVLDSRDLLVLQGMPAWRIEFPQCHAYPLVGAVLPPALAASVGRRVRVALESSGG